MYQRAQRRQISLVHKATQHQIQTISCPPMKHKKSKVFTLLVNIMSLIGSNIVIRMLMSQQKTNIYTDIILL